ncbi:MAG: chemotaxis protein CheX [Leptospirales bacterium]|jgi:chemotaxis protein CheX
MTEQDMTVFVTSVLTYFERVSGVAATIGIPRKKEGDSVMLDYTGIIGISGQRKGCVYFTTTGAMLQQVIQAVLGESDVSETATQSMAGEIANTIAGYAQESLGEGFSISVPVVVSGRAQDVALPDVPSYVLPVDWKDNRAYLVVGVK